MSGPVNVSDLMAIVGLSPLRTKVTKQVFHQTAVFEAEDGREIRAKVGEPKQCWFIHETGVVLVSDPEGPFLFTDPLASEGYGRTVRVRRAETEP